MAKSKNDSEKYTVHSVIILTILALIIMAICATETYSEGERIGYITKFSNKGRFWKSWEGELNLTQTGMNTSSTFQFSIDNDDPPKEVIAMIDSAANLGWKIKLNYHETSFKNWFQNRVWFFALWQSATSG